MTSPGEIGDLVAVWDVPMQDRVHRIEFEHGTTTGKRIVKLDGKEILRREWMFKLVGRETFEVGKTKCAVSIDALGTFAYEYTLEVNGKPFKKFTEQQSKILQTWTLHVAGVPTRICLEKDSLDIWVNGRKVDTAGEFVEDGTETHFEIGDHVCYIKAQSSGKRKTGMVHYLFVDGVEIAPSDPMTA